MAAGAVMQPVDIAQLTKLAVAVDTLDSTQAATAMALPDPDGSKGANVDTYA